MADALKTVRDIQKGLDAMSKKLENSRNQRLREIDSRLKEINKKIEKQFGERGIAVRKKRPLRRRKHMSMKKPPHRKK